ncbi:MAG: hypothetical protein IPI83_15815 [Sphingomonadales bacterium]|nr:hypothetical protein [Sphingomonadales bacterium]
MRKTSFMLSVALCSIAVPAIAQNQTAQAPQTGAETNAEDNGEIIVTATRREEQLSDVPLAVSAISGQALQNSGVTDIRALNQLAPSHRFRRDQRIQFYRAGPWYRDRG